jgi:hypothetical protein
MSGRTGAPPPRGGRTERATEGRDRLPSLWFGLLAGPVAWTIQLPLLYALAVRNCDHVGMASLHVVSLLCVVGTLAGGHAAWRNLQARREPSDAAAGTRRLMALLGLMAATLFGLVVLWGWLAVFLLSPCPS